MNSKEREAKDMSLKRGDIVIVDLGNGDDDEDQNSIQKGIRPVILVSCQKNLDSSTVYTGIPLTTNIFGKKKLPTHIFVSKYKNKGLNRHSIALCEQVRPIATEKILDWTYGSACEETMRAVNKGLMIHLELLQK